MLFRNQSRPRRNQARRHPCLFCQVAAFPLSIQTNRGFRGCPRIGTKGICAIGDIRTAIDESSRSLRKLFAGEEYVPTKNTKGLMVPVSRFFSRHFAYLVGKLSDSCGSTPRPVTVPSSTEALRFGCTDSKRVFRIIRMISVIRG